MTNEILYRDLLEELVETPTVDAHEHLPPEESRLEQRLDFFSLFEHYCVGDLVAAGAREEDLAFWRDRGQPVEDRWQRFEPFFSAIRTTGYGQSVIVVLRELLGYDDLNDDTYQLVGDALQKTNRVGRYDEILRDKCNIAAVIQSGLSPKCEGSYYYYLAPSSDLVNIASKADVERLEKRCDRSIHSVDDLLDCMGQVTQEWGSNPRIVGLKSAHAYYRSLEFRKVPRSDAQRVFETIMLDNESSLGWEEARLFEDFLMFELVARASASDLAMVFHTGLQAGNMNRISNANPLLLQTLLQEFPQARVDLFHGGMPWVREIAVLAKYFPGVHLNMAWMHIISPTQARAALAEWLDMVPNTKIFGFGGDYFIVEKVYGHLTLARRNIARVLAEKVSTGVYSRSEASILVRQLMLENPARFYGIETV